MKVCGLQQPNGLPVDGGACDQAVVTACRMPRLTLSCTCQCVHPPEAGVVAGAVRIRARVAQADKQFDHAENYGLQNIRACRAKAKRPTESGPFQLCTSAQSVESTSCSVFALGTVQQPGSGSSELRRLLRQLEPPRTTDHAGCSCRASQHVTPLGRADVVQRAATCPSSGRSGPQR